MKMEKLQVLAKRVIGRLIYFRYRLHPLEDKVVFANFSGKRYGDSPKYISQELHRQNPEIPIIWLCRDGYEFAVPDYVKKVKWRSLAMLRELCTARVWVTSHTWPVYVQKRKGQFCLETWHGGIALKKVEGDAADKLDYAYIKNYQHNARIADVFLSGSDWTTKLYRRAMGFEGKVVEWGIPRNDLLLNGSALVRKRVRSALGIEADRKILLYAPTFRNEMNADWLKLDFNRLQQELGENWTIFVRLHPVMMHLHQEFLSGQKQIADVSLYPDIQELIAASDMLITDYSSLMFDFAMIGKPAFIYAADVGLYEKERGFYFDLDRLPFPFADTTDRLIENIRQFDRTAYKRRTEEFFRALGMKESGCAARFSVWLLKVHLEACKNTVIEEICMEMKQREERAANMPYTERGGYPIKRDRPV